MFRKTAFQAMDISLNTFIIFAEIYYVLSKLMLCFYVLKNKAILSYLILAHQGGYAVSYISAKNTTNILPGTLKQNISIYPTYLRTS